MILKLSCLLPSLHMEKERKAAERRDLPVYILPKQDPVLQQYMVLTVNIVTMTGKERPEVMLPDR